MSNKIAVKKQKCKTKLFLSSEEGGWDNNFLEHIFYGKEMLNVSEQCIMLLTRPSGTETIS